MKGMLKLFCTLISKYYPLYFLNIIQWICISYNGGGSGTVFKSFLWQQLLGVRKSSSNQNTKWKRVGLSLDWPGYEGWSHESISRCGKAPHLYQEQLTEGIRGAGSPSRTPHFPTWMKSLRCQLELNTESESTQRSYPFHPSSGCICRTQMPYHDFIVHRTLIYGKKPKNFTAACYFDFVFAFS